MKPINRVGIVAIFRNEFGRRYGLKEIGNRKSWHRWQTPDGKRHRFAKDACAYLDGLTLKKKAQEVREEMARQGRIEMARAKAEEALKVQTFQAIHTLAVAWRIHRVEYHGIAVRPLARQAAA